MHFTSQQFNDVSKATNITEIRPLIPTITKGGTAPKTGKYDNKAILRKLQESSPERNPLHKGVTEDENPYDFREFLQAEDVDGYMATTFRLTIEQCLKQGFSMTGSQPEIASSIYKQFRTVCKASSTTPYSLIEDICTGLTKFNNGFLVVVRKEYPGSKFKKYRFRGKDVKPIAGLFYTEPQYMTPVRKAGRISKWEYKNPDIGAQSKDFKPEDVIHFYWNRKGSDVFGTPWTLPGLDDVRMLRRLEEFAQMLISKHLFPIFQYKVGTKEQPTIEFEGGTSEVATVEAMVGDLPQQGCIFTSHRHEVVAIDTKGALDISKYLEHFDGRALSSLGLSAVDIGRGDSSNKGTAQVMNQTRVDRCTRIQRVLTEFFNDQVVFSFLMELGLEPFDLENEVTLEFAPPDTEERRSQEKHDLEMFQNDMLSHDETRKCLRRKPFQTDEEWDNTHSNTTRRIQENQGHESSVELEKRKAVTKQNTTPANQTNKKGKSKPKVSKNA